MSDKSKRAETLLSELLEKATPGRWKPYIAENPHCASMGVIANERREIVGQTDGCEESWGDDDIELVVTLQNLAPALLALVRVVRKISKDSSVLRDALAVLDKEVNHKNEK